ncbi:hypothetical protein [Burkholderia cenocepacia]|uniref:PglD-related sugar-binding protein n=1 Tax=Burkholderia cenocepacia TaxID=95486 RepID=UPI002DDD84BF|nr:hypothetical protein [Burkholderia cenocepacia]MEC4769405.1 hypothetical protein [Burkholderia cenocepacia]
MPLLISSIEVLVENIVIVGSSGHAKVVIDVVEQAGRYRIAGLIDSFRPPPARRRSATRCWAPSATWRNWSTNTGSPGCWSPLATIMHART